MKQNTTIILILTFFTVGVTACQNFEPVEKAKAESPTTFKCINQDGVLGTFAVKNNAVSQQPMISWITKEFGDDYTPQERCEEVSDRLTKIVGENSGKLANLNLKTGFFDNDTNNPPVVCAINKDEPCNKDNLVFTLSEKNRQNPDEVLKTIFNFAHGKTYDNTVYEGQDGAIYVPLKDLVDPNLGHDTTTY